MKPIYILALVLAAVAGGLVVKFAQKTGQPVPAAVTQTQPQAQAPAPENAPAPSAAPAVTPEPEKPSALPPRRETAKQQARKTPKVEDIQPVARPQSPPPQPAPTQTATAAPAPAPANPEPAPVERSERIIPLPPPPPPPLRTATMPAGTLIPIRLIDGLASDRNKAGDTFTASLDAPLVIDGVTIAERGARAEGKVVSAEEAGRVRGLASLQVALTRIHTTDGQVLNVDTEGFSKQAQSSKGEDAKKVGVGAALGGLIGAIAGGGKGAAIGAATGAGAGGGVVLATRGEPARLPSETRISFRLTAPVTYTEKR